MGVIAGKAKCGHFLVLATLEFSRDLLIAATCFQSEYLERPNAKVKGRRAWHFRSDARAVGVPLNDLLGW
jgi:hypothetical protein